MEYLNSPAYNQSFLKKILGYPEDDKDEIVPGIRKHISLGNTVDAILSYDNFDELISIYNTQEPSELISKVINNAFKLDPYISDDSIIQAIDLCGYKGNKNWDTIRRLEEIKQYSEYIEFLKNSNFKLILTEDQYNLAKTICSNLYTAKNTEYYISAEGYRQLPIYFKYEDIDCKALLDKVIETDTTIQPIDYKVTSSPLHQWKYVAKKFRYDFQAAFYTEALRYIYPNKTVLPFVFIVASSNPNTLPYVYKVEDEDLSTGKYGLKIIHNIEINEKPTFYYEQVNGFHQAIQLIKQKEFLNLDNYDVEGYLTNRSKSLLLWNS